MIKIPHDTIAPLVVHPKRSKKPFTKEEDQLINSFVKLIGTRKWAFIAKHVSGRTAKQCRDRYMNYLKPGLSKNEWTKKEDKSLLELHQKYGPKWSVISKYFNNRNQVSLKNRFLFLQNINYDEKDSEENELISNKEKKTRNESDSQDSNFKNKNIETKNIQLKNNFSALPKEFANAAHKNGREGENAGPNPQNICEKIFNVDDELFFFENLFDHEFAKYNKDDEFNLYN